MTTTNINLKGDGDRVAAAPEARKRKFRLTSSVAAAIVGVSLILILVSTAVFAKQLSPYDPAERVGKPFEVPSAAHKLGTNDIGQDILSELIYGTRVSLIIGFATAVFAITLGTTVGLLAGYYNRMDSILMRVVDIILVIPFLPLLIMLAAYMGRSMVNTVIIIGLLIAFNPIAIGYRLPVALSPVDVTETIRAFTRSVAVCPTRPVACSGVILPSTACAAANAITFRRRRLPLRIPERRKDRAGIVEVPNSL